MKRIFLFPVAMTALLGATSMAQAAPAPSALDAVRSAAIEQGGKATQVHYRYYHRYYHHRHHHHRHHHHHHRHHRWW